MTETVRGGGGVVLRETPAGLEVLLVHRPRYDDWSLPKGKLLDGESEPQAALREVEEETGFGCELGPEVGATRYHDRYGRPKTVRYWLMRTLRGAFEPHDEVDEVAWLPPGEAVKILTYERDCAVVESAVAAAAER